LVTFSYPSSRNKKKGVSAEHFFPLNVAMPKMNDALADPFKELICPLWRQQQSQKEKPEQQHKITIKRKTLNEYI